VVCHSVAVRDIPNRLQGAACRILSTVKLILHKGEISTISWITRIMVLVGVAGASSGDPLLHPCFCYDCYDIRHCYSTYPTGSTKSMERLTGTRSHEFL